MLLRILSIVAFLLAILDYGRAQVPQSQSYNITPTQIPNNLTYTYNSLTSYQIHLIPKGCVVYVTVEYQNAKIELYWDEPRTLVNPNPKSYYESLSTDKTNVTISPKAANFLLSLEMNNSTINSSTVTIKITAAVAPNVNASPNQLSPGSGMLYDFATMGANNSASSTTFIANSNATDGRLVLFFACDASRVNPFNLPNLQNYCARIMFFQGSTYVGNLRTYMEQGSMITSNLMLKNLTIYQSYVPNLFAQVYIHSPQEDNRFLDRYVISANVIKSELNPTNQYNDNLPTEIAFDLRVHFVKLEQNNQTYLSYVNVSRTAKLLVYEGIAEIKGYDLPKDNLIATITASDEVNNMQLTKPVYTFVAINDYVYYEITDSYGFKDYVASFAANSSKFNIFLMILLAALTINC